MLKMEQKIIITGKNAEESFSATEYVTNLTNIWTDFFASIFNNFKCN